MSLDDLLHGGQSHQRRASESAQKIDKWSTLPRTPPPSFARPPSFAKPPRRLDALLLPPGLRIESMCARSCPYVTWGPNFSTAWTKQKVAAPVGTPVPAEGRKADTQGMGPQHADHGDGPIDIELGS